MNFILSNRSIVISLLISFVAFVSSENHGKHLREQIETNYRDLRSCKSLMTTMNLKTQFVTICQIKERL